MLQVREKWVLEWFGPEGDEKRTFKSERDARWWATKPHVAPWNPLLVHRTETTIVEERLVPL